MVPDDTAGYVDGESLLCGSLNSTNAEDIYVQTFIVTNQALTLVPYTILDGSTTKVYTTVVKDSGTNVAKSIGTSISE